MLIFKTFPLLRKTDIFLSSFLAQFFHNTQSYYKASSQTNLTGVKTWVKTIEIVTSTTASTLINVAFLKN